MVKHVNSDLLERWDPVAHLYGPTGYTEEVGPIGYTEEVGPSVHVYGGPPKSLG